MNVTNNGYYTSSYLNEYARKKPPKPVHCASATSPGSIPRSFSGSSPMLTSGSFRSKSTDHFDKDHISTDEISVDDPDKLAQGITPAELYYLQRRPEREDPRRQEQLKHKYSDYYIQQKRRYDEAEYKPKIYTHKTFRDVFQDEEEPTEKYNPMEFVFDDPELIREREQNQKVKRAFKNMQKLMGKNFYDDYDYYQTAPTSDKKKPDAEVYVANLSDSSDEDDENPNHDRLKTKVYVNAAEEQQLKQHKKFSKLWKRRLKKAKKELRKDYENNTRQEPTIVEVAPEPEEEEEPQTPNPLVETNTNRGVNENFHPLWNYVLSWLAYETVQTPNAEPAVPSSPSVRPTSVKKELKALIPTKRKNMAIRPALANFKLNYKGLASKWNQPVRVRPTDMDSFATAPSQPKFDNVSDEFIVEIDSDVDESTINTELYYNPVTKLLEHQPPTSASALSLGAAALTKFFLFSRPEKTLSAGTSDSAPVVIVSNINTLLKHIKILRIIFAPIDIIAENFPNLQTLVILIELAIFMWLLYELSLLIDALCMMVKAVCAPMIAMGRFMNRIM